MANRKISDLTALTAPATGDLLPIVDISEAAAADKNKKITFGELFASIPAGTAAAPSIAFEGDSNTGIYSPGADQVAISTNGTGRLFVDASGRVSIGTTSEPRKLHVSNGYIAATSLDGSLVQLISNNGNTGDYAGLGLLGGNIGGSFIHFGDTNNAAVGSIGYFHSDDSFRITTNASEKIRINSTGQISSYALAGSGSFNLVLGHGSAASSSIWMIAGAYGATGVNTGTASFLVATNGNVTNTNNSYGAISDAKLKENIVDATPQWDDLKALQVRNYNFKEGQTHTQIGLVAQEVELVSPGLVTESPDRDEDGNDLGTVTKSVNYSVLYIKAVKALQEAMERIEVLEQRLTDAGIA